MSSLASSIERRTLGAGAFLRAPETISEGCGSRRKRTSTGNDAHDRKRARKEKVYTIVKWEPDWETVPNRKAKVYTLEVKRVGRLCLGTLFLGGGRGATFWDNLTVSDPKKIILCALLV